jgi:hypothetical protein
MNRINIIVWLSAGVMIGWFTSWIIELEQRRALKQAEIED